MSLSRRTFLKRSAGAAALTAFPAILRSQSPNSKFQIAAIGASGKGWSDISEIGSHPSVEFVALCDVDSSKFKQAAAKYPSAQQFTDFREMLVKLGDKFDAVTVSTPDHLHAPAAMAAMRLKKHVYCQKPLTHTLWEARQMRLQAEKSGVITQMGNQIHSASEYRTATRLIREGTIGKVKAVYSWQNKPGNAYTHLTGALPAPGPVPETMAWDLWIGPAPMREYAPGAYHPASWRDWQDFGGGVLGDFGCHIMDPVFTSLGLTAPTSVRAENSGTNPQTWPESEYVTYVYPGTEFTAGKELTLHWFDGGRKLPEELWADFPAEFKRPAAGSIFVGEGGVMLLPHVGMPQLFPQEKFSSFVIIKEKARNHYHDWVDGAMAGTKTTGGFHYGGLLTEAVHLGNIATRVPGVTLQWSPSDLKISNSADAEKLITKAYRKGWEVPSAS